MDNPKFINQIPEVLALLENANHIDIKIAQGNMAMRAFIAGMLSYQPAWVTFLYRIRWVFVRLLGMKQKGIPQLPQLTPADVPMAIGKKAGFFTVTCAVEDEYWVVEASESHLSAYLGVLVEPLTDGNKRFYILTIVYYHRWTGPLYFNVIRPFHYLVVGRMVKAGLRLPQVAASAG